MRLLVAFLLALVLGAPTALPAQASVAAPHHGHHGHHGHHAKHHQHQKKHHGHKHKHHGQKKHQHGQKKNKHKHRHKHRAHHRPSMTVGTYNLRAGMGLAKFRQGVRAVRRNVGVAGLQEIGNARRHRYLSHMRGWGYYHPRYIRQNPVIWNKNAFTFVKAHGDRIARSRYLHNQLPGATRVKKDSTATVVRLRHRASGRKVVVINVHLVHGAVKGGKPWPRRPKVYKLYVDQVRGLTHAVRRERRWGRVFVVGDFNAGYRADKRARLRHLPYRQLSGMKLNSMWQGTSYLQHDRGTHSDALIDQIWSKRKPQRVRILRWVRPSDHFPAVATYRLRRNR